MAGNSLSLRWTFVLFGLHILCVTTPGSQQLLLSITRWAGEGSLPSILTTVIDSALL